MILIPEVFPDPGACLAAAVARERLLMYGPPWAVTRDEKARLAAMGAARGRLEDEVSFTGGTWPFDDDLLGTLNHEEYRQRYQREYRKRKQNGEPVGSIHIKLSEGVHGAA